MSTIKRHAAPIVASSIHIGIRTDDLESLMTHMRTNGVVFRKTVTEDHHFRYVMCEAPDGVVLELYEVKAGAEWMVAS
jgi:hypothetical protein